MNKLLRQLFFLLVVRPVVLVLLGLNVRHRERLPVAGPAMIVANHNSHLDTLVLMTLFPPRLLGRLRPAAAMDYFLRNRFLAWFALNIIGIIPVARKRETREGDPLAGCHAVLDEGGIVIFFPEGSRGEPERLSAFRSGIYFLASRHPDAAVVPVFLHGLGKALPRGEFLLVPFFVDVFVGDPLTTAPGDKETFMAELDRGMQALAAEGRFPAWD